MHTPNIHTIMISKGYNSILGYLLIYWACAVSFAVGRAHRCDFFVACLGEQLANRIVNPTARGLLLTDVLNRILLGCVESQSTDLGASAEVSANRIKSAELVCVAKSLCVDLGIIMLYVSHNLN